MCCVKILILLYHLGKTSCETHIFFFISACFKNDEDDTPKEIKPEVTHFFEKLDVVEHCFFNNSQVF